MDISSTIILKENPDIIFSALELEAKDSIISDRAKWSIKKKGDSVHIIVSAKDATAFRAVMNTIIKALSLYEKAKELK